MSDVDGRCFSSTFGYFLKNSNFTKFLFSEETKKLTINRTLVIIVLFYRLFVVLLTFFIIRLKYYCWAVQNISISTAYKNKKNLYRSMSVQFFDVSSTEVNDQMGCTSGLFALLCFLASVWVCVWVGAHSRFGVAMWLPLKRGWRGGERGVGTCSVEYEYVIFGG